MTSDQKKERLVLLKWTIWGLAGILFILFLILVFFINAGWLIDLPVADPDADFVKREFEMIGTVGDSINGIFGPFIASLAVLTTFLAFYVQYQANAQLRQDIKRERFDSRYSEMLLLHKEIVQEIRYDKDSTGRHAFVDFFYDFRYIFFALKKVLENKEIEKYDSEEVQIRLAYNYFFFGVDQFSGTDPDDDTVAIGLKKELFEVQKEYSKRKEQQIYNEKFYHSLKYDKAAHISTWERPFRGSVSSLGHYYRHLYQMVKYIVSEDSLGLSFDEKYQYLKLLRSQMSNYEQLILFLNSIWEGKGVWWSDSESKSDSSVTYEYFLEYNFAKNLPLNLTEDLGIDAIKFFKGKLGKGPYYLKGFEVNLNEKLKSLFEWPIDKYLEKNE